jgi:hypothetical protein
MARLCASLQLVAAMYVLTSSPVGFTAHKLVVIMLLGKFCYGRAILLKTN